MKIVLSKKNRTKYQMMIYQAFVFIFVFIAIRYAYPTFFPYYANQYLTVLIEPERVIIGSIVLVLLWFFLLAENKIESDKRRISSVIMTSINYVYFLPGIYMNMFYDVEFQYAVIYGAYCTVINLMVIWIGNRRIRPAKYVLSKYDTDTLCVCLTIIMILLSIWLSGFRINLINIFDSQDVYATRLGSRITGYKTYLWYFIVFGATIIPTWFVIALKKKQYSRALIYVIAVLCMFNVSANRQFVFTLAVALVVYIFRDKGNLVTWIFMAMWIIPCIELWIGEGYVLSDILRRFAIVPNIDGAYHVDYFLDNEPDYLRQALALYTNRLGFVSPYDEKIATMIGYKYFGYEINANTGLVGGNFANYGYAALILGPLGYSFSFWLLDKFYLKVKHKEILLATAITIAFSVTNYETWIELFIVPSWIFFYYIAQIVLPTHRIEESIDSLSH